MQDTNLAMASLNSDFLFTNILLDETISESAVNGISSNDFRNLLNLATKESLFTFNKIFYTQSEDVAMESSLGPIFPNNFLSSTMPFFL